MKTLKFLNLLISILILTNCTHSNQSNAHDDLSINMYDHLLLRLLDSSGNDLIKGIGLEYWHRMDSIPEEDAVIGSVSRELYSLEDIYHPDPFMNWFAQKKTRSPSDGIFDIGIERLSKNDFNFLLFTFYSFAICNDIRFEGSYPPADKIVSKLKCPYIFGDDAEHEITTYWRIKSKREAFNENYVETYVSELFSIELDGKEATELTYLSDLIDDPYDPIVSDRNYAKLATFVIDR